MPQMRTIHQAAEYVKARDPESALTKTAIRRLVISGTIPSVRAGTKYLLSLENLDAYLSGEGTAQNVGNPGCIRPVEVRL